VQTRDLSDSDPLPRVGSCLTKSLYLSSDMNSLTGKRDRASLLRFEVHLAVVMKCQFHLLGYNSGSSLKANRNFEGIQVFRVLFQMLCRSSTYDA
jgi:hypothetical protein